MGFAPLLDEVRENECDRILGLDLLAVRSCILFSVRVRKLSLKLRLCRLRCESVSLAFVAVVAKPALKTLLLV
jgi:hypothetical protein